MEFFAKIVNGFHPLEEMKILGAVNWLKINKTKYN